MVSPHTLYLEKLGIYQIMLTFCKVSSFNICDLYYIYFIHDLIIIFFFFSSKIFEMRFPKLVILKALEL